MVMLPRYAQDLLDFDLQDAEKLAGEGQVEAGYKALQAGRHIAEAIRENKLPWGEELVRRYEETMEEFAERYKLRSR
jgi:hypothetical protein